MIRSLRRTFGLRWLVAAAFVLAALAPRLASAAPKDAAASKLRDEAIYQDYLATNFADAQRKLTDALTMCAAKADCAPATRARLHCDLGAVDFALQKGDDGRAEFAAALKEDPNVALDKDLTTTELQKEFAAVKSGAPAGGAATPKAQPPSQGDFIHTPPAKQAVNTPIPIYAALPPGKFEDVKRVEVHYKGPHNARWKNASLEKTGDGYGGLIPCGDVGSKPGAVVYVLQAKDSNGDVIAKSGKEDSPFSVEIVKTLAGEAPHLPDQPAPAACAAPEGPDEAPAEDKGPPAVADKGDCPPGMACGGTSSTEATSCSSDGDCMGSDKCVEGVCSSGKEGPTVHKENWLSLGLQVDLLFLSAAQHPCAGGSGYTCYDSSGNYYKGVPEQEQSVNSGIAVGTKRVMLGYDRAVTGNFVLGGRLGFAFGGEPGHPNGTSFLPIHAEARVSYWFGSHPLARSGLRFFALAGGGAAEVDAPFTVKVEDTATGKTASYSAYHAAGQGFADLGLGSMIALTANTGFLLEVKIMELFPTSSTAIGAQLGYTIGL